LYRSLITFILCCTDRNSSTTWFLNSNYRVWWSWHCVNIELLW